MGEMYARICNWENLRWAHQKAARGKRGKRAAAGFEYNLADNLNESGASNSGNSLYSLSYLRLIIRPGNTVRLTVTLV
jgi:hypothetical protein